MEREILGTLILSCNIRKDLKLSDRIYQCNPWGLTIDRDLNAAMNIRNAGLIVVISLIEVSHYVPVSSLSFIPNLTGNFLLYTKLTDTMQYTSNALNANEIGTISSILIDGAAVAGIGGLIGGAILPNENTFEN